MPYLRNSIAYDHGFWYTCANNLQVFFSFFWNFHFSGCYRPKIKNNNSIHHMPYLRNSIAYDHDSWYTCIKWYLQVFFFSVFFSVFIFQAVRGVKGQKIAQNDKKFCLVHFISQGPYIIWLSFMVHLCKMMISPGAFFHFFKILIFWVVRRVKGQKWPRMTGKSVLLSALCTLYIRNHTSYDLDLW